MPQYNTLHILVKQTCPNIKILNSPVSFFDIWAQKLKKKGRD